MPRQKSTSDKRAARLAVLRPLGEQLKRLRLERDLSQPALAHLAGLNYKYLGRVEKARANPSAAKLISLAGALGVTVGELFQSATPPDRQQRLSPADLTELSTTVAALKATVDRLAKGQPPALPRRASRRPRR